MGATERKVMMVTTTPVIQTVNLTKIYKSGSRAKPALDSLNLSIRPGEIFGYLGPNGAGKTTTIRLLLDLIRPTAGRASILGLDTRQNSVELHRQIGYLPGELSLWDARTARQVIQYVGSVRGSLDMNYVESLAERLEFDMNMKVRSYSSGNKRKLGLIIALMSKPKVLILDEPTTGLDPLMQQIFLQLMREVRAEGRTVFLSSHILNEVQEICDRVGILRSGQLKEVKTVSDLVHTDFRWVTLQYREAAQVGGLAHVRGVTDVTVMGNKLKLKLTGDFDPLLRAIGDGAPYIVDMEVQEPTLEEIFLTYYGDTPAVQKNHREKKEVLA
jgi:ABC-2 type transport system ATP-binding protein